MDHYKQKDNTEIEQYEMAIYLKLPPSCTIDSPIVRNQEEQLAQFLQEHGIAEKGRLYADTDWQAQPEWEHLIEDVRSGKISCIAVTEFSRFGRDYLERDHYLSSIFPKLGIRFLSMAEDYDSNRPEDAKKLYHPIEKEWKEDLAKKLSERIRAAKKEQAKRGEVVLSRAPYGYKRTEDRRNLVVDKAVADYVRAIFQWTMLGAGKQEIARRMNLLKIATPGQYLEYGTPKVDPSETKWTAGTIQKILQNPCYTGDIVTGRIGQSEEKGRKQYQTAQDTWLIQKDKHTPLISRDDYEALTKQEKKTALRIKSWRKKHEDEYKKYPDLFPGLVFCAQCGKRMHYVHYNHDPEHRSITGARYQCGSAHVSLACANNRVDGNRIKIAVLDKLREVSEELAQQQEQNKIRFETERAELNTVLRTCEKELHKEESLFLQLCTQIEQAETVQNMEAKHSFLCDRERLIHEIQNTKKQLEMTEQSLRSSRQNQNRYEHEVCSILQHAAAQSFDSEWVSTYIKRIDVSSGGTDIKVTFQYPKSEVRDYD